MAILDDLFRALENADTPWAQAMRQQMLNGVPASPGGDEPQARPMPKPTAPVLRSVAPAVSPEMSSPPMSQGARAPSLSIGGPAGPAPSMPAPSAPAQAPVRVADASGSPFGGGGGFQDFMRGAGDHSSVLGMLFGGLGEVGASDLKAAQSNATFRALKSRGLDDAQAYLAVTNPEVMKAVIPALFGQQGGMKPTDEIREYNFAKQQGYGGSFMDYKRDMKMAGKPPVESLTTAEKAVDRAFGKEYENLVLSGGLADAEKGLSQLREVSKALKDPKGDNLTGWFVGRLPDAVTSVAAPEVIARREAVEEVVQRNLRAILGAQFTRQEGERLIARAYNPTLDEAENAKRVDRLLLSMEKALNAKRRAADYYEQNGTMKGFKGAYQFSTDDLIADVDAPGKSDGQQGTSSGQSQTLEAPPASGARKAPDGNWYVADPDRPGKYLRVKPASSGGAVY